MEELFDRLIGSPNRPSQPAANTLPVDITEHEGNFLIRAAVPGVEPNELDIQIEKNVLTIKGETHHQSTSKDERIYRREMSYGLFSRSIRLPEGLDLDRVDAEFKNGIVTITLPRVPEEKPRAVRVNVRGSEAIAEKSESEA